MPPGTHIVLDVPSIYVRIWVIEGVLSVADELDVLLEAEAVIVSHGEFRVGSAATPHVHNFTLSLKGHWASARLPVFGIKVLGLTQGTIRMHAVEVG